MLKKSHRLPIQYFQKGKAIKRIEPPLAVYIAASPLPHSRFGVVVSKAVYKEATKRIALRRTIFRIIAERKWNAKPGRDILIYVLPAIDKKISVSLLSLALQRALS